MDNWRRRQWGPAIEASGIPRPARIYDLRSTFASDALAAGVPVFTLARVMGTSVRMIERHYGALLDGASEGIASWLAALEPNAIGPRPSAPRTFRPLSGRTPLVVSRLPELRNGGAAGTSRDGQSRARTGDLLLVRQAL